MVLALKKIKKNKFLKFYLGSYRAYLYWHWILNKVKKGIIDRKFDAWDYIWVFENFINEKLHVTSKINLISNIGIGLDSSNTKSYPVTYIPSNKMERKLDLQLIHPVYAFSNHEYDIDVENKIFSKSLQNRLLWFFRRYFRIKR